MTNSPPITCPNCGTEIELTEALAAPLHAKLEAAHHAELARMQAQIRGEAEARVKVLVNEAEKKVRADASFEKQVLERQLADDAAALENRARDLDLEVARWIDIEKQQIEETVRRGFAEQHDLKLKEKERLIDDLRRALEEAKR